MRAPSSSLSVDIPGGAGRHPPWRGSPSGRMRTCLPCRLTRHILNGSIEEVKSDITNCRREYEHGTFRRGAYRFTR